MKRFEMIYFALPLLILFGIRTTIVELLIPGTDVISSHLSFYLYGYEIFITLLILTWFFKGGRKYFKGFLLSIAPLVLLTYLSPNTWLSFLHILRGINLIGFLLWGMKTINKEQSELMLKGLSLSSLGILLIAIAQFTIQSSVGLQLFHEAIISPEGVGIAKFEALGEVFIRPYSILPHPNVLGWLGVTMLSLVVSLQSSKHSLRVFFSGQLGYLFLDHMHWTYPVVQYLLVLLSALIISAKKNKYNVQINQGLIIIISTGMILFSASRLAWGLFIALSLMYVLIHNTMFHVEHFSIKRYIGLILVVPFVFFGTIWRFLQLIQETSLGLRELYLQRSIRVVGESWISGTGVGNYIFGLSEIYIDKIPEWQYEPVHNAFILVFAEVGIIGALLGIVWLYGFKKLLK